MHDKKNEKFIFPKKFILISVIIGIALSTLLMLTNSFDIITRIIFYLFFIQY
jgi:hypothetical protein